MKKKQNLTTMRNVQKEIRNMIARELAFHQLRVMIFERLLKQYEEKSAAQ